MSCVDWLLAMDPFQLPSDVEHYADGLRKAGFEWSRRRLTDSGSAADSSEFSGSFGLEGGADSRGGHGAGAFVPIPTRLRFVWRPARRQFMEGAAGLGWSDVTYSLIDRRSGLFGLGRAIGAGAAALPARGKARAAPAACSSGTGASAWSALSMRSERMSSAIAAPR
jgi:hypothetical protein